MTAANSFLREFRTGVDFFYLYFELRFEQNWRFSLSPALQVETILK